MRGRSGRSHLLLIVFLALSAAACGPPVDLTKGLQVEILSTGWQDAGIVDGKNKLVPSVSFRLKNVSAESLVTLQVNALFRRLTDKEEWGSAFLQAAGSSGLKPGAATQPLVAKSQLGYTGNESRVEMLKNSLFVDAKVTLFAKYGSAQWTRLGDYSITRQLLTQ
jgi:hypothetical protein